MRCPQCQEPMEEQSRLSIGRLSYEVSGSGEMDIFTRLYACTSCRWRIEFQDTVTIYPMLPDESE